MGSKEPPNNAIRRGGGLSAVLRCACAVVNDAPGTRWGYFRMKGITGIVTELTTKGKKEGKQKLPDGNLHPYIAFLCDSCLGGRSFFGFIADWLLGIRNPARLDAARWT